MTEKVEKPDGLLHWMRRNPFLVILFGILILQQLELGVIFSLLKAHEARINIQMEAVERRSEIKNKTP